jgi:hypothetical protein
MDYDMRQSKYMKHGTIFMHPLYNRKECCSEKAHRFSCLFRILAPLGVGQVGDSSQKSVPDGVFSRPIH